jgi:cation diffusion facilitator CzcD-associated flavoprotein CzcO
MSYLRSPHVHNLSYDPFSLVTFSRTRDGAKHAQFIPVFSRPSLALFNAHAQQLIDRCRLQDSLVVGYANRLRKIPNGWCVETEHGSLEARRVILAIGATKQPLWTQWAQELRQHDAPIHHVFDSDFDRTALSTWTHAVVVGGGISAAQLALSLARQQPSTVTLLMRHPVRQHSFDSDPCWVTSICLKNFHAEADFDRRRAIINKARHRGSVPADVAQELRLAGGQGLLRISEGEVTGAAFDQGFISLQTRDEVLNTDYVILATGFKPERPGTLLLDYAISDFGLPVAACGYPIVDTALQWAAGLHVTGPLAELEIGPTSRNIIGARLAGERIGSVL